MSLDSDLAARNPRSAELFRRQQHAVPGGFTHASRQLDPFPLFIESNAGARKRDVDGHEYIDYWAGHGALLLGHGHPAVVSAIQGQLEKGFHAGGETELGLEWAELIKELVPSAASVRFTSSGGEANQLALRVARAATGRDRVIRFTGGFHGWFDGAIAAGEGAEGPAGVPPALAATVALAPPNDLDAVVDLLDRGDVAAVLLEPAGISSELVPSDPDFLRDLRRLCSDRDVVLIFDEVVSGFRWSRGGAQERFGVTPDLTSLGKVMGGGLPAGALAGRSDLMEVLGGGSNGPLVPQPGTWNAMPIVAAAGVAALREVRDHDHVERAIQLAGRLTEGLNAVFDELDVPGFAYGRASLVRLGRGPRPRLLDGDRGSAAADQAQLLEGWGAVAPAIRKALLLEGVDLMRVNAFVSSAHSEEDVDLTCQAFERALGRLRREGLV